MRGAALGCLAAALLALPATARAEAVTGAQLRSLAARAQTDPGALARLRGVDAVDGRPVDVAAGLRGASGGELRARLAVLSATGAALAVPSAGEARGRARAILRERRFRRTELRGPFHGLLERIGRGLDRVGGLIPRLDRALPGGRWVAWLLVVGAVALLAWLLAGRTIRRRAALATAGGDRSNAAGETPEALERRAAEAERRGEHELVLRLRFRAGLLRLDARGVIAYRPSLPTGEVARTLHSPDFDRLATGFDEVVYGRRPAGPEDVEAAREAWDAVLGSRRR